MASATLAGGLYGDFVDCPARMQIDADEGLGCPGWGIGGRGEERLACLTGPSRACTAATLSCLGWARECWAMLADGS